jgi:hypothetical protein
MSSSSKEDTWSLNSAKNMSHRMRTMVGDLCDTSTENSGGNSNLNQEIFNSVQETMNSLEFRNALRHYIAN